MLKLKTTTSTLQVPPTGSTGRDAVEAFLKPLSAEDIRLLADRHKLDPALLMNPISGESATFTQGEQPADQEPLTRDIVAQNNLYLESFSADIPVLVDKLFPDLAQSEPADIIHTLTRKFEDNPTVPNGALLQRVMNQYTSTGECSSDLKEQLDRAKSAFHKHSPSGGTDDIWYQAWVDANYSGASLYQDLLPGYLYLGYRYVGDAMNDKISSIKASCSSSEVGGYVMLFENANFNGRFKNYSLSTPRNTEIDVKYINDFNDIASSTLILRRYPNEIGPISLASLVPLGTIIDIVNNTPDVRMNGSPTLTWDLWPQGGSGEPNDPSKRFIYLNVPIQVNTHQWFFGGWYDCQIRYWIYVYVDGNGQLQGYVNWWGTWVQGGLYTGPVSNALQGKVPGTLGAVNSLVAQALSVGNAAAPFSYIYYLPGNGGENGNTSDGVSIVAVKRGT